MFKVVGQVVNIFTVEAGEDKEGNPYEESHKVQLLGKMAMPNGECKMDMLDLKVDTLVDWKPLKGKTISVDVGEFAPSKGRIIHFIRKGSKPSLVGGA